ncbi:MAG: putative rane protein YphA, DoxX/SURF4 family [Chthoniobacteraceae bacterium]|nr:putative rane protein YphA, DoxX/SURF4 family [Chthoniobacteraceae bacterium]
MLKALFKTPDDVVPLILRVLLGAVFFPHGAQKVLGWFGGHGFSATMAAFTGQMHIPALFAFLAIAAEFAGSLALITGFFTRVAAFGIAAVMAVAMTIHWRNGFFMNWSGTQAGEGFEYHLMAAGIALVLIIRGGGKWSLDAAIEKKFAASDSSAVPV